MPRKKKKRQHKLIGFKAYFDTDVDILDWWEGIADGERSHVIRDVIREHLGLPAAKRKTAFQSNIIQMPELVAVRQDTEWIRNALNDMPDYLQNLMQEIAASRPIMMQESRASPELQDKSNEQLGLNNKEQQRRNKRMRKATW